LGIGIVLVFGAGISKGISLFGKGFKDEWRERGAAISLKGDAGCSRSKFDRSSGSLFVQGEGCSLERNSCMGAGFFIEGATSVTMGK